MKRKGSILLLAMALFVSSLTVLPSPIVQATSIDADTVGVTHVGGRYNFSPTQDFLNEGADQLLDLGTRVIKLWFRVGHSHNEYPFNSTWPSVSNLTALAQTSYYSSVFSKPFTTYILEAYESLQYPSEIWQNGMTPTQLNAVQNEFYLLTKYLMNTYANTGKTFILQNWEGDNALFLSSANSTEVQGMIDWLNARQAGINQAKAELSSVTGVYVYGAAEATAVNDARTGAGSGGVFTNQVIPNTNMDLYSYSAYDIGFPANTTVFTANLNYLKSKAPDSTAFGANNIYIGEFGMPENEFSAANQVVHVQRVVETALNWGAQYAVYWQLYCNEPRTTYTGRPTNSDLRGFWLIRPDGTKPPLYDYFSNLFSKDTLLQHKIINDGTTAPNRYQYNKFSNKSYTFQTGGVIEYDVRLLNNVSGSGGIDITNTDSTKFRDSGWVDQNGVSGHPIGNLSAQAYNTWFHRTLAVPGSMVGKTSSFWSIAGENDTASATYTAQYDNIRVTNNVFSNNLDYNSTGILFSSGATGSVSTPSNTLQLSVTTDSSATANRYSYHRFSNKAYTFQPGDVIEYDVKLSGNISGAGGIDIINTDSSAFRDSGWHDVNGIAGHPVGNLSSYANNVWFHRKLTVPDSMIGKTAAYWVVAGENDAASSSYSVQYDNIRVTNTIFEHSSHYNAPGIILNLGAAGEVKTISK